MKDIIIMSNRELHRVEILQKLIDKQLIEPEAAEQLSLSVRQIRRLKKAYKANGAKVLSARNVENLVIISIQMLLRNYPWLISKNTTLILNLLLPVKN